MSTKTITEKAQYTSKIIAIDQGKDWEGTDKVIRTEWKVHLANGHTPVFNVKTTKENPNRLFPFEKGKEIVYLLTEKEMYNKIRQYGQLDMTKTNNLGKPVEEQSITKDESIALAVAAKLAETTYNSSGWQDTLKLKAKASDTKDEETVEQATIRLQAQAQTKMLSSVGQLTMAYYKLLTKKPQ